MTLSATELAGMREDIETLLPDTCVIQSKTSTPDGMGGQSESWSASGTANCRLDRQSGNETVAGGAIRPYSQWVLTMPYQTSVTVQNRAEHGGLTYNIVEVNLDKSWPDCVRAIVEQI